MGLGHNGPAGLHPERLVKELTGSNPNHNMNRVADTVKRIPRVLCTMPTEIVYAQISADIVGNTEQLHPLSANVAGGPRAAKHFPDEFEAVSGNGRS